MIDESTASEIYLQTCVEWPELLRELRDLKSAPIRVPPGLHFSQVLPERHRLRSEHAARVADFRGKVERKRVELLQGFTTYWAGLSAQERLDFMHSVGSYDEMSCTWLPHAYDSAPVTWRRT